MTLDELLIDLEQPVKQEPEPLRFLDIVREAQDEDMLRKAAFALRRKSKVKSASFVGKVLGGPYRNRVAKELTDYLQDVQRGKYSQDTMAEILERVRNANNVISTSRQQAALGALVTAVVAAPHARKWYRRWRAHKEDSAPALPGEKRFNLEKVSERADNPNSPLKTNPPRAAKPGVRGVPGIKAAKLQVPVPPDGPLSKNKKASANMARLISRTAGRSARSKFFRLMGSKKGRKSLMAAGAKAASKGEKAMRRSPAGVLIPVGLGAAGVYSALKTKGDRTHGGGGGNSGGAAQYDPNQYHYEDV